MIAYKYVIKKNKNTYQSLLVYGIDAAKGTIPKLPNYKLNKIISNPIIAFPNKAANHPCNLDTFIGYHLFKEPFPLIYNNRKINVYDWWTTYLTKINKKNIEITILKCSIEKCDIIIELNNRVITNKFMPIEEFYKKGE